jgi:hypothetical protein
MQCPSCQAELGVGESCEQHFHQMLFWEAERPEIGVVHHLMVLAYHLQHPHLYSPEGLDTGKQLLVDFVAAGLSPEDVRQRSRDRVDSGQRAWKITARPGAAGAYANPVLWTMSAADVVAGGIEHYCDNVRAWAEAIYDSLKSSGNLS